LRIKTWAKRGLFFGDPDKHKGGAKDALALQEKRMADVIIMKPNRLIVLMMAAFFLFSCASVQKKVENKVEDKVEIESPEMSFPYVPEKIESWGMGVPDGFEKKEPPRPEGLFKDKVHVAARTEYEKYLSGFKGGDPALMKTGKMRPSEKTGKKASGPHNLFLGRYPEIQRASDADIQAIEGYYNSGDYRRVIELGMDVIYQSIPPEKKFRVCNMVASSYAAIGSPEQGIALLTEFIEKFPWDENAAKAKNLVKIFKGKMYRSVREAPSRAIGCLLPLTGPYEVYGNKALKGIQLALMHFSSQDQYIQVKIIIKDTESNPDTARSVIRELDSEDAFGIIGPITPLTPAVEESQSRKIPIITLIQTENITDIGDYVFRNFLTPRMQVEAIVTYAFNTLGIKRFAVLYPDENYGVTFAKLFQDNVLAYGGSIAGVEFYDVSKTDFAGPINKIANLYYERLRKSPELTEEEAAIYDAHVEYLEAEDDSEKEKPDLTLDFEAIFIPDSPKKAGLIIPQLAFYDIKDVYLLGTNLWHSMELIDMAKEYAQNAIIPDAFFKDNPDKETRGFVDGFRKVFDEEPGYIEALAYDTAMILFKLMTRPDVSSRKTLKKALAELHHYPGVTGMTSFYSSGDVWKNIHLLKIKEDRFVVLENE